MAQRVSITENDILEALAAATSGRGPDVARTVPELVETTGLSARHVRSALKLYARQGRLEVYRVMRPRVDGPLAPAPAYTVKPNGKPTGKPRDRRT